MTGSHKVARYYFIKKYIFRLQKLTKAAFKSLSFGERWHTERCDGESIVFSYPPLSQLSLTALPCGEPYFIIDSTLSLKRPVSVFKYLYFAAVFANADNIEIFASYHEVLVYHGVVYTELSAFFKRVLIIVNNAV